MGQYDRNLIVSLLPGKSTRLLQLKCEENNTPTDIIIITFNRWGKMIPLSHTDKEKFKKLTGSSRLYMHGHSYKGNDTLGNNMLQTLSCQSLALMIANHVNPDNIAGLRIRLFACYSSASSLLTTDNSLASGLMDHLIFLGLKNIQVIGNADFLAIDQIGEQIYAFLQSDIEESIRNDNLIKHKNIFIKARSDFLDHVASQPYPTFIDETVLNYIDDNLTHTIMRDKEKIDTFMSHLCEKILQNCSSNGDTAGLVVTLFATISQLKEALLTCTEAFRAINVDDVKTDVIKKVKQANYARPFAKVMFTWDGEKKLVEDCYQSKRMALGDKSSNLDIMDSNKPSF